MKNKGKERKEKESFKERLCHSLDIQPDVFPKETHIEISGRGAVSVVGAGRVSVYTDTEICIEGREAKICVRGERLKCSAYRIGYAQIDGRIESVSFLEGGK